MACLHNRITPAGYTIGSWQDMEVSDAHAYLRQEVVGTQGVTVARCVYWPESDYPTHSHPEEQITIVEEGELVFQMESEEVRVRSGEMISIPARKQHSTLVKSKEGARALNLFVVPGGVKANSGRLVNSPTP